MAVVPLTPGVYVQELPSGVHPITGVSTSNTAFVDWFPRGPIDRAVRVSSWAEFEDLYGGLNALSEASYAIRQYFMNGGGVAFVARSADPAAVPASFPLHASAGGDLKVSAASPGLWGGQLQVAVDHNVKGADANLFNLVVREVQTVNGKTRTVRSEVFRNLDWRPGQPRSAVDVVKNGSALVVVAAENNLQGTPDATGAAGADPINNPVDADFQALGGASDGAVPGSGAAWTVAMLEGNAATPSGMYLLDNIEPDNFNILCIPGTANFTAGLATFYTDIQKLCGKHRAMYILDAPSSLDNAAAYPAQVTAIKTFVSGTVDNMRDQNTATYVPRLSVPDPLSENRPRLVGASGTLAGIWARIDANRGVWKAPAGTEATLGGASLFVNLIDDDNGTLNSVGVNVLRSFPVFGTVSWGARTLEGADVEASQWKYIPVRRTALFIEESLFRGLKWVVFEPNAEPLWAQIRLNVGAFMHDLFRKGAFAGLTPREAYLVKCDSETTTQTDIDNGIVNIVVGFAPLKPAEFVIIQIEQLAGQIQV